MKRFSILSGILVVVSGVAAAFAPKNAPLKVDKQNFTGTCHLNANATVSCIVDHDLTASCLTSGVVGNSANIGFTSNVVGDCTVS